jgi:hypothetical protein
MAEPRPLQEIPAQRCAGLRLLFTDLDDTMTEGGLLPASTFECLWALAAAAVRIVVVTGRPAGWCDHIARMWPVAAAVGENGALVYAYDRERRRMDRAYLIPEAERRDGQRRLARIRERVLREVPACAIAADQPFRLADLAIDYREDAGPLNEQEVRTLCGIIESEGASYRISSIHINCWYGDFDKVRGVRRFLADRGRQLEQPEVQDSSLFIGDSPNDEPLFRALAASIGVANIRPFLERMRYRPAYLTERPSAAGFAEAVGLILARR